MQQIERYGVIALVFLLVTIVAVSFWGDSKSPGFWSRLTGRGAKKDASSLQIPETATTTGSTGERAIQGDLPMSPATSGPSYLTPLDPAPSTASTASGQPMSPVVAASTPPPTFGAPLTAPAASITPTPAPALLPKPAFTAPERVAASSSEYVVQKGDNLMLIASRTLGNKSRWTEIRDLNHGVEAKNLRVGTKLVLPASASATKTAAPSKIQEPVKKPAIAPASKNPKASPAGDGTYVVRKGDTLKSISERLLGSSSKWKELAASNPKVDANHITVGTTLHVPDGSSAHANAPVLVAAALPNRSSDRPHVR